MKILHLIDSEGLYGAEKMLIALCSEQRRLGHDARVLSARAPWESERAIDVELHAAAVPVLSWPMQPGLNLRAMREICVWIREHGMNVLHSHGYKFDILLGLVARRENVKKVATVHGYTATGTFNRMRLYKALDRISHFAFDRVVFVSDSMRRRRLGRMRSSCVIPNGIDVKSLPPTMIGSRAVNHSGSARLVAVGRLAAEKDYELLVCSMALLVSRGIDVSLDIFGEGPEESKLRGLIDEKGLKNVWLRGYSRKIPWDLLEYDILVVSSRTEGMPLTVMEAMCLGMKIVATPVGGIPGLLKGYPVGVLTKDRSAVSIAEAIEEQIRTEGSFTARQEEDVRALLSSATMASRYIRLYEDMLRGS